MAASVLTSRLASSPGKSSKGSRGDSQPVVNEPDWTKLDPAPGCRKSQGFPQNDLLESKFAKNMHFF